MSDYQRLKNDFLALNDLAAEGQIDQDLLTDFFDKLRAWQETAKNPKKFIDEHQYDHHDVILTISAGAGGLDANDWVGILGRLYQRWGLKEKVAVAVLNQSPSPTGGFKSLTISLKSNRPRPLYRQLKFEDGVHRLVRYSPFKSRQSRQTSFARVDVVPLIESTSFDLAEADLDYQFFKAGGAGGQSVNKTDSAVRLTHRPTETVVVIQNERSQHQNKQLAKTVLVSRLESRRLQEAATSLAELKGPPAANQWGSQIRNYIFDPYQLVKDLRTGQQSRNLNQVLDGQIEIFWPKPN